MTRQYVRSATTANSTHISARLHVFRVKKARNQMCLALSDVRHVNQVAGRLQAQWVVLRVTLGHFRHRVQHLM
jgi:hypothetical protein